MNSEPSAEAVRMVLRDAFSRVRDQVRQICGDLTPAQATYRPDRDANSISWLIWHLSRIQDDHVSGLVGDAQLWMKDGWYDRFGLPFDAEAHGYGHTSDEVAKVRIAPQLLDDYHAAVDEMTQRYVDGLSTEELRRVVDTTWDPPVTCGVRLVSVLGDCLAHLGQAEYVRGLAERTGVR